MGVYKTIIRIPFINRSLEEMEEVKKRLVLFLEDTDRGLDIEQATYLKEALEDWLVWANH